MNKKILVIAAIVVAIIAVMFLFRNHSSVKLGSAAPTTNLPSLGLGFIAVGSGCTDSNSNCTGSQINQLQVGQCYIQAYSATIAASSTAAVDCQGTAAVGGLTTATTSALTGVQNGDFVQATLSTTTAGSTFMGLHLAGASASTTAGYITLRIANLTGGTFTWPTSGSATGTVSYIDSR